MNKHNLIRLGAFAQARFYMADNFKIIEVASDASPVFSIAITPVIGSTSPYGERETVELKKYATGDNAEYVYMAYARKANTLVIREPAVKDAA